MVGENFDFFCFKWRKNALNLSIMVGEYFEMYLSQFKILSAKIIQPPPAAPFKVSPPQHNKNLSAPPFGQLSKNGQPPPAAWGGRTL